jgi:hypothetical protein
MDNKNVEIFTSVVYKEFMQKSLDGNLDFEGVKNHVQKLLDLASALGAKTSVPFHSAPVGSPRGAKVAGNPCEKCGTPMITGNKGVYCKPCFIKWAESKKAK